MPIARDTALAHVLTPVRVQVERGALRFFATATGETRPEYVEPEAARAAGHRDLPVPPTNFISLELQGPDPLGILGDLGVDLRGVLHGEQWVEYVTVACAGDTLTLRARLVDVGDKKGGAMQLLTKETTVTDDATGALVARLGA